MLLLLIELESIVVSLLLMNVCFIYGFILCLVILVIVLRWFKFFVIRIIVMGVISIIVWLLKVGVEKCGKLNQVVWLMRVKLMVFFSFKMLVIMLYSR